MSDLNIVCPCRERTTNARQRSNCLGDRKAEQLGPQLTTSETHAFLFGHRSIQKQSRIVCRIIRSSQCRHLASVWTACLREVRPVQHHRIGQCKIILHRCVERDIYQRAEDIPQLNPMPCGSFAVRQLGAALEEVPPDFGRLRLARSRHSEDRRAGKQSIREEIDRCGSWSRVIVYIILLQERL